MVKNTIWFPVLMIAVGAGWLLTANDVIPGVNWTWVLALAVIGILVLATHGFDKVTTVVGPFLIASTIFSLLRQTGRISADTEAPCLLILAGVLMVISCSLRIPAPRWLVADSKNDVKR